MSRLGGLAIAALVIALLPLGLHNSYSYDLAIRVALNATAVVGLNLLVGHAGQISLGHAAFLALGAYGSAILCARFGWPPMAALASSAAGVGAIAFVVGRPIFRLRGHYLAMATLGLGVIISIALGNETAWTGGADGTTVPPLSVLGVTLSSERAWYWTATFALLVAVTLAENLVDSPVGRAVRALHGSETAAEVAGVDTARYKLRVFVVSAVFASVVGSLTAHHVGYITPQLASFFHSIELVTMVVVGGMASTWGGVLGAVLLTVLPQLLTRFEGFEMIAFGLILMLTVIFLPRGLLPSLRILLRRILLRRAG